MTIDDISLENAYRPKEDGYKFTCGDCEFVTKKKENIDEHVATKHTDNEDEEGKYLCIECKEELNDVKSYEEHTNIHKSDITELKYMENLLYTAILEKDIDNLPKDDGLEVLKVETIACTKCALVFVSEVDMNTHMAGITQEVHPY